MNTQTPDPRDPRVSPVSQTDADGIPQPLEHSQYAPGDWGCALWHVWPAATFASAHNTHSGAPACPICAYPLWRIWTIDTDGYVYIQGRDPEPEPEGLAERLAEGTE